MFFVSPSTADSISRFLDKIPEFQLVLHWSKKKAGAAMWSTKLERLDASHAMCRDVRLLVLAMPSLPGAYLCPSPDMSNQWKTLSALFSFQQTFEHSKYLARS